ncbi:hypothetical protein [Pseudoduganella violaceinigra]|uniref:hypothetical protein n=1 Tax=Pseudoduganella violaceinigra TaxID=246602 RepID=UPI000410EC92|nr:hypothetical protein [Pseudoduganella violaceinigra]
MHTHRLWLRIACAAMMASPFLAKADNDAAMQAAKRGLAQFAEHQQAIRPGSAPVDFPLDITDVGDLKQATINQGFEVYTIEPKDLLARGDLASLAKPTGEWRFIISVRGKAIGLATVQKVNGRYETVAYGAAVLAKDVDAAMNVHGNSARSNLRFIRIYQARSDLLEVDHARFAPLHSARESLLLKKNGDQLVDGADLLEPLRAAVKANIEAFR